jgi:hypothetical protein
MNPIFEAWPQGETQLVLLDRYRIDERSRILCSMQIRGVTNDGRAVTGRLPMKFVVERQLELHRGRLAFVSRNGCRLCWRLGDVVDVVESAPPSHG